MLNALLHSDSDDPFSLHKRLLRIADLDEQKAKRPTHKDPLWELISAYLWDRDDASESDVWDFVDSNGVKLKENLRKKLSPTEKITTYGEYYAKQSPTLKTRRAQLYNITSPIKRSIRSAKEARLVLCSPEIVTLLSDLRDSLKSRADSGIQHLDTLN